MSSTAEENAMRDVEDRIEDTHRKALDWLGVYVEGKEQESAAKTAKEAASKFLKPYLDRNGALSDGETGWKAELGPAPRTRWVDFESIAKRDDGENILVEMAKRGMLQANFKAFDALGESQFRDTVKGYIVPGEGTRPIKVTKEDLK